MRGTNLGQMDGSAGKGTANELYNSVIPRTHMCKERTHSCRHSSSLYTQSVTHIHTLFKKQTTDRQTGHPKLMTEKDYLE